MTTQALAPPAIGVDLGGTKIEALVLDAQGRIGRKALLYIENGSRIQLIV
jgi:predicted NBD/HSP70 family sugar kinase